ncbi:hypothetical protein CHL67_05285 [Prosthecochloris sp. GSB1]|uniref:hypothetical protein n=1 Tax=Prosthecochloris sp. GSB1 TaxID=281093 RepID=UPI000B8C9135|nr:hypothetical protein [Prosthecochloris sp. GSB1]ASQ90414.1 hypothetical protein CHL67_05285 [Prosthecochloris sp. GSB1]
MTFSFGEIRMAFDFVIHSAAGHWLPHRDSLSLGKELAFDFVDERLPEEYSLVRDIFADTENARGRFREMLESSGALRERLEFETSSDPEGAR